MFKTEKHLIEVLTSRSNKNYGINNLKLVLKYLNNPEERLKVIQIGGTNGKGSTTNFCRSILQSAGFKVGTFTSPHLVHHRDRIRINNQDIPADAFIRLANQTLGLWDEFELSMFEIDLIIAILYFIEEDVDYTVFEVGLGGRLDASNVLIPNVIGITNVGLDHVHILGDTVEEIAKEKAGIFKKGVPVYSSEIKDSVKSVFNKMAYSPVHYLEQPNVEENNGGYHVYGKSFDFDLLKHPRYQASNANLAIELVLSILPDLSHDLIRSAISEEIWAGRFEEVLNNVYLDGAHNEMGVQALANEVKKFVGNKTILFTALADKDTSKMLDILENVADDLVLTEFNFPRAAKAKDLAEGREVKVIKNYKEAIDFVLTQSEQGTVFITGSLYFISLASDYIKKDLNKQV